MKDSLRRSIPIWVYGCEELILVLQPNENNKIKQNICSTHIQLAVWLHQVFHFLLIWGFCTEVLNSILVLRTRSQIIFTTSCQGANQWGKHRESIIRIDWLYNIWYTEVHSKPITKYRAIQPKRFDSDSLVKDWINVQV